VVGKLVESVVLGLKQTLIKVLLAEATIITVSKSLLGVHTQVWAPKVQPPISHRLTFTDMKVPGDAYALTYAVYVAVVSLMNSVRHVEDFVALQEVGRVPTRLAAGQLKVAGDWVYVV
jgi:hypothetical protein